MNDLQGKFVCFGRPLPAEYGGPSNSSSPHLFDRIGCPTTTGIAEPRPAYIVPIDLERVEEFWFFGLRDGQ